MKPEAWSQGLVWVSGLVLLLAAGLGGAAGRCIHGDVQRRAPRPTRVGYGVGRALLGGTRPIRIVAHYPGSTDMVLSQEDGLRLNTSIQEALTLVRGLLAVVPVRGKLLLSRDMDAYCKSVWRNASLPNFNKCGQKNDNYRRETCLDIVIPDDHLQGYSIWPPEGNTPTLLMPDGAGLLETDFILYVKVAETSKCRQEASVIAYAVYCKVDQNGRPIAGAVTLCHSRLRGAMFDHRQTVLTTVHELLHALGFSKDLFSSWLDCTSASSVGSDCSSRSSVTNTDHQGSIRIYTHSVIQQMQIHLNSTSADLGVGLENWESQGMPSSHWESRILQGSIMTATLGSPDHTFIDRITLAAMEDTGWYQVNYQQAQGLPWGQGRGDTFGLTTMCHNDTFGYFCSGSGLGCHYLHREKGRCETDVFLDGCRIYKPLLNQSECWKAGHTATLGNLSATGEIYGESSRCFFANLSREAPSAKVTSPVGRCYLHRCLGLDVFEVKVQGSDWLPCLAGRSIQVPGYHGQLSCPRGRLCQSGTGGGEDRTTENTIPGSPSPEPSPLEPTQSSRALVRVTVWLAVSGSAGCSQMEDDGEAEDGIGSLVESAIIPRCQVRQPRLCSPSEICFELVEYSGCSRYTVPFLLEFLKHSVRLRQLQLTIGQEICTAVSIRSGSTDGSRPPLPAPGSVLPTALCSSLALALVGGLLGAGIYHRLHRARGRVHDGGHRPSEGGPTIHRGHRAPISSQP